MKKWLILLLVIGIILELIWGYTTKQLIDNQWNTLKEIELYFRVPRMLNAIISGMALAMIGLILQTIFHNPLAGPYVLGISSGSAFGVAIALMFFSVVSLPFSFLAMYVFSILGAFLVIIMLMLLARRYSMVIVIIAGVIIAGLFGALINILQYFSPAYAVKNFVLWTMASLDLGNYRLILANGCATALIGFYLFKQNILLDSLYLGEEYAMSIGVNVKQLKITLLTLTGILIAMLTSSYGPIAFVGVISPHIARWISKSQQHKDLLVTSILVGAVIMLWADFFSHALTITLPLNSVLSLFGLPVMLLMVIKQNQYFH